MFLPFLTFYFFNFEYFFLFSFYEFLQIYLIYYLILDKERGGGDRSDRGRDGGKRGREREEITGEDDVIRRLRRQQVRTFIRSSARTYTCTRKCYLTQYLIKKRKGNETESFLLILMITLSSNYLKFQLILFL